MSDVWHGPPFPLKARQPGPDPERNSYGSFCSFTDPDANLWIVQEVTTGSRAGSDRPTSPNSHRSPGRRRAPAGDRMRVLESAPSGNLERERGNGFCHRRHREQRSHRDPLRGPRQWPSDRSDPWVSSQRQLVGTQKPSSSPTDIEWSPTTAAASASRVSRPSGMTTTPSLATLCPKRDTPRQGFYGRVVAVEQGNPPEGWQRAIAK